MHLGKGNPLLCLHAYPHVKNLRTPVPAVPLHLCLGHKGILTDAGNMEIVYQGTNSGYRARRLLGSPLSNKRHSPQSRFGRGVRELASGMAEAIWTTRCIICDTPGRVLCDSCRICLPFIDRWLACPRCGSPYGRAQCVDCNTFTLAEIGRSGIPFERCVSAIEHRDAARSIVTGYKDAGERRLAGDIARMVADAIPQLWIASDALLAYVPADRLARRRRGFDHMALVAEELARMLEIPCGHLLRKTPVADQRGLSRRERFANMSGAIRAGAQAYAASGTHVILVDDVYTTGATLFAACDALHAAGIRQVHCATFARVP